MRMPFRNPQIDLFLENEEIGIGCDNFAPVVSFPITKSGMLPGTRWAKSEKDFGFWMSGFELPASRHLKADTSHLIPGTMGVVSWAKTQSP